MPCALGGDVSQLWEKQGFSSTSSRKVRLIPSLKLSMRIGNLWDALSCLGLEGRIRRPEKIDQNDWQKDLPSSLSEKGNKRLPRYQMQIPRLELYTEGGLAHRKDGSAILATRCRRGWKRNWLWPSRARKNKEGLTPIERFWKLPAHR